ncbi:hypothetical protein CEXT_244911 [Caerostris extrusa]|uniref:Uncharacterized protein n=1 Tax=Caerostris extrusa TaxID=172846 RepID=A0AAV4YD88_CAEEX|nr:hypothetical protein CEXT_244911 [Caerostris extrusa]
MLCTWKTEVFWSRHRDTSPQLSGKLSAWLATACLSSFLTPSLFATLIFISAAVLLFFCLLLLPSLPVGTEGHLLSPGDSGMSRSDVGRLEPGLTEMPTFESHPNT